MNPAGICGRADLARLVAGADEQTLAALAALLGYQCSKEPSSEQTNHDRSSPQDKSDQAPLPQVVAAPLQDIPFWLPWRYQRIVAPPREERTAPQRLPAPGVFTSTAPEVTPLADWPEIEPRLRAVATAQVDGEQIDIRRLVQRLARGDIAADLPRRRRRRWGESVQVVFDRSDHLAPFWRDQDYLFGQLQKILGSARLSRAVIVEAANQPLSLDDVEGNEGWRLPPPGGVVLLLGDMGAVLSGGEMQATRWAQIGRHICEAGCRAVCLTPVYVDHLAPQLNRHWRVRTWERVSNVMTPQQRLRSAEKLLTLLAPAIRIEPGLLRAVRRLLPDEAADASVEAAAWNHRAIAERSCVAATPNAQLAAQQRRRFAELEKDQQQQAIRLIRNWRNGLNASIWYEELLRAAAAAPQSIDAELASDLASGRKFMAEFAEYFASSKPEDEYTQTAQAWFRRLLRREDGALWRDETVGQQLHRHACALLRDDPGDTRPAWYDPALSLTDDETPLQEQRIVLRQSAGQLVADVEDVAKDHAAGSYLAALAVARGQIIIAKAGEKEAPSSTSADSLDYGSNTAPLLRPMEKRPAICTLPASRAVQLRSDVCRLDFKRITKPHWASAMGRDGAGLWLDIVIEGVIQRFRWIPPGEFLMGSPKKEAERYSNEGPQHRVILTQGYWLADTACTQELWRAVMGNNPSDFEEDEQNPVEDVSWNDCHRLLAKLNGEGELEGWRFALPTEAQWEYACRAGTMTPFWLGRDLTSEDANYDGKHPYTGGEKSEYRAKTVVVKRFKPNPWGLWQMHGNVWEWCADFARKYSEAPQTDPEGREEVEGRGRALRGGSWFDSGRFVRAAYRSWLTPDYRGADIGLRLALRSSSQGGPGRPEQQASRAAGTAAKPGGLGGEQARLRKKSKKSR